MKQLHSVGQGKQLYYQDPPNKVQCRLTTDADVFVKVDVDDHTIENN
jgi:hypothetical protein